MYLIDSFVPVLAYVVESIGDDESEESVDYNDFRNKVLELLEEGRKNEGSRIPQALQDSARFAVVVFVDEYVLSSGWSKRHQWARELLQKQFFNTNNGGVEFFDRLDTLSPYKPFERDVLEVYYYCLSMGFVGGYYRPEDRSKLAQIRESIGQAVVPDMKGSQLFPDAYQQNPDTGYEPPTRKINYTPLYLGMPFVLLFALFVYFQSEIRDLAQQFLLMV